jgi:murein DD-endopeptidase MepM/ murein hydrolase activator NlpD
VKAAFNMRSWILLTLLTIPIFGCGSLNSYRGPGQLQLGLPASPEYPEEGAPGAAPVGPTLSGPTLEWSGERLQREERTGLNFDWPVDDARLSRGFLLGRRWHYGIDLAAPKGTLILAAESGTVIYTGSGFRGYGKLIVIEHDEKWATLYAHLDKFSVQEGDRVKRGQKIGEMGRTGRATGVHLHFEIRYNRQPVNPLMYLPQGY